MNTETNTFFDDGFGNPIVLDVPVDAGPEAIATVLAWCDKISRFLDA